MCVPVLNVLGRDRGVVNNDQVLRVMLFCGLGEIERARDHRLAIYNHDLVVRNGVKGINQDRHVSVLQEGCSGVTLMEIALVEDDPDIESAPLGVNDGLRDRGRREAVRLDQYLMLSRANGLDDGLSGIATLRKRGAEANLNVTCNSKDRR